MNALPTLRGVEHVAFTVPDIDAAIAFFVDVLGCELVDDMAVRRPRRHMDVGQPRRAPTLAVVLRCAPSANFEIFQYESSDQVERWPRMSDWGGMHIAFYVDDMDASLKALEAHGVRVLGGKKDGMGPEFGAEWSFAHFLAPWGQMLELVSYPKGRDFQRTTTRHAWRPELAPARPGACDAFSDEDG